MQQDKHYYFLSAIKCRFKNFKLSNYENLVILPNNNVFFAKRFVPILKLSALAWIFPNVFWSTTIIPNHREKQMEIRKSSQWECRANSRYANGQAQRQGAIKSRANADLKLHPSRRHYRIASPRITVAFLSYLSYPRQECNTGNRTPGHGGWHADIEERKPSRTRVPSLESHDDASTHNVRTL